MVASVTDDAAAGSALSDPPARLLDVTRHMRRLGRIATGVDRVELAYMRALLDARTPVFGLIRSRYGYLLLDRSGLSYLVEAGATASWATIRKRAIARVPPPLLGWMLRRKVPRGVAYLNVGHSNLTARVLSTLKRAVAAHISVLIHDVIPLDFPEFQRDGTVDKFAQMLARVGAFADLIICNSADTQARLARHLPDAPRVIVAHLGTEPTVPAPQDVPEHLRLDRPYFLCVGTIEPRKNHAFLLDVWDEMGPDAPALIIAGRRGWKNEDVFARLDALPKNGPVREAGGLTDGAIAALLTGTNGLLFPSHCEGFGLPVVEAAALGVPVLANDLPAFREVLGNIPIYVNVTDRYLWKKKIESLAQDAPVRAPNAQFVPPTWDAHFKTVLRLT